MTSFIHLTDLHIGTPGVDDPHLSSDTTTALTNSLAAIRALDQKPDFILISGDLVNHGDAAAYAQLKELWGAQDIPALFAIGNHDDRQTFRSAFLDETENLNAPYCYDVVIAGVHVIVLDSSIPGSVDGNIEPEQFDWLEQALTRNTDLPRVVMIHHPPKVGGEVLALEHLIDADNDRLAEMLQDKGVVGIFSGHVHHDRAAIWHGIPLFVSNGMHNRMDPTWHQGLRATDGIGYSLCTLRPSGIVVDFLPQPNAGKELMKHTVAEMDALISEFSATQNKTD